MSEITGGSPHQDERTQSAGEARRWQATALRIGDNVAVALEPLMAGDEVVVEVAGSETKVRALDPIALGHKIALAAIRAGDAVIKYGECVGEASQDIPPGAWVHIHNLRSRRARPTDTTNVFDAQAYANAVAAALALPIPAQSLDIVAANLARLHGLAVELLAGNE